MQEEQDLVPAATELTGLEPGEVRIDPRHGDETHCAAIGLCDGAGRLLKIRQIGISPSAAATFVRSYNSVPDPEKAVTYRVVSIHAVLELVGQPQSKHTPRRVVARYEARSARSTVRGE